MTHEGGLPIVLLREACEHSDWSTAAAICTAQLAAGGEIRIWKLQLALVNFLWEGNIAAHDIMAPRLAHELANELPTDPDVVFWAAYIIYITTEPDPFAVELLRRALQLDPLHPYANLVMAGHLRSVGKHDEAVGHLTKALEAQPGNVRVLRDLVDVLVFAGRPREAVEWARRLLDATPYVEREFLCANDYANDVLTGAGRLQEAYRLAAEVVRATGAKPPANRN